MNTPEKAEFVKFVKEVKAKIQKARLEAFRLVNQQLIELNWNIGKLIIDRQEAHSWGKSIVEHLSKELQSEFPGTRGYSVQNLWYMRQFYLEYRNEENLQPLVGEISWAKNIVIMSKCKDNLQRKLKKG